MLTCQASEGQIPERGKMKSHSLMIAVRDLHIRRDQGAIDGQCGKSRTNNNGCRTRSSDRDNGSNDIIYQFCGICPRTT